MKVGIIEIVDETIFYAYLGEIFSLQVTEDMCLLSLSREEEYITDYMDFEGNHCQSISKDIVYPSPSEISKDEAQILVIEHCKLAIPLSSSEIMEYARTNPEYLVYL